MTLIQLQKVSLKPKDYKTLIKNSQLSVSKAFETSILRAKLPQKLFLSKTLIASEAKAMKSFIFLPLIKPLCSFETIFGRIFYNISASTLEMI